MSVLCCRVPDFLIRLACRRQPELAGRPLALLGPDERVWAVSREARLSGVCLDIRPRQAQTRCPDVLLRPLDVQNGEAEQSAFIGTLAQYELPVEGQTWGQAYIDLNGIVKTREEAIQFCLETGRQVRKVLGEVLQPALGCDRSKFTSRAAASYTKPGHLRRVDHSEEVGFLNPLQIQLLPLPPLSLQQLGWLGVRTLGQFARLPKSAVWQRFGKEGKISQSWAQGRDERPVCPNMKVIPLPICIDFDPPTSFHTAVLEAMLTQLRPHLLELEQRLEGCRRLRVEFGFADHSTRVINCTFVEPVADGSRLRTSLSYQLQTLNWSAELETLRITLLERGELVTRQLTLFQMDEHHAPLVQLAQKLSPRYGAMFFLARLTDGNHHLAERRVSLNNLSLGRLE